MTGKKTVTIKPSKLAGVDKDLFANRKPPKELEAMRKDWDNEFDKIIQPKNPEKRNQYIFVK